MNAHWKGTLEIKLIPDSEDFEDDPEKATEFIRNWSSLPDVIRGILCANLSYNLEIALTTDESEASVN